MSRIRLLEEKAKLRELLPHLYGQKFYKWARQFFESRNKNTFLVAANQIGKSSVQIRKCIHWATEKELWPELWKSTPRVFWYMYPNLAVSTIEAQKKWIPEFLPRGEMKDHPKYGWTAEYKAKSIHAIHFNSGVSVYFKPYSFDSESLQTSTVSAVFCDEELSEDVYDEVNLRRAATDGFFSIVFTATQGQEMWRRTMEEIGTPQELFKDAEKIHATLYDCLTFEDGTKSHWTKDHIIRLKNSCKSEAEVQKRIMGRFVVDDSLLYPSFNRDRNVVAATGSIPSGWQCFSGVDLGSGGEKGHPAAIVFLGVNPTYTKGRIFRGWRGDGEVTTASDVLDKYIDLRRSQHMTMQLYDFASRDFQIIASRMGESFIPADKSHQVGEGILNTLFKNQMLEIEESAELLPLIQEILSLNNNAKKNKAKNDFTDAMRYACSKVPWDWSVIKSTEINPNPIREIEYDARRDWINSFDKKFVDEVQSEIDEWNNMYDV